MKKQGEKSIQNSKLKNSASCPLAPALIIYADLLLAFLHTSD
ncbi:hypothetical protein GXM_07179 [Nostoc sphaeroides CCNUC1]|uniref:Uncharacterized protein n=1 Tax=Nostoc sphaeroides CCNUC1 TaxID=2653204 RepID=A0A5P8WA68_9NOSO|nr:hypothetical protein GXM_07179 [Nostoc sphaeroides CCNUC1]